MIIERSILANKTQMILITDWIVAIRYVGAFNHEGHESNFTWIQLEVMHNGSDSLDQVRNSGSSGRPPVLHRLAGMETAMESVQKTLLQMQHQVQIFKTTPRHHTFKSVQVFTNIQSFHQEDGKIIAIKWYESLAVARSSPIELILIRLRFSNPSVNHA